MGLPPTSTTSQNCTWTQKRVAGCFRKIVSTPLPIGSKPWTLNPNKVVLSLELYCAGEGLAKSPIWWHNVLEQFGFSISGGDPEGQRLGVEIGIGLPISTPVSWHCQPSSFWAFDVYRLNRSSPCHIANHNKLKIISSIYGESNPTMLLAWNPAPIRIKLKSI